MAAITEQKQNLREILERIVMDEYDGAGPGEQRVLTLSLLGRYTGTMTLAELRAWHRGIQLRDLVRERAKSDNTSCEP